MTEAAVAQKPAVLFITRKWPPAVGGMETYCVELVRALEPYAEIRMHALPGRPDGTPPTPLNLIAFGAKLAGWLLGSKERYAAAHGADMAVWPLAWLAGARRLAPRLVLSAHGTDVAMGARASLAGRAYGAYLKLGAKLLPDCLVIANSAATAALVRRFGFHKVQVVHLAAVEPTSSHPVKASGTEPYVAFVGRLIPRKGCAWFIRNVLPRLPQDVRLKVAGTVLDPSERDALQSDRVDYLGPVFGDALAALRRDAVAVVIPNLDLGPKGFEGFGLTAVEAAMDGAVAVAAGVDGLVDAVIPDVTGFLESPGDAASWSARIERIRGWSASERSAFIATAKDQARTYYNWGRVAQETSAAYSA